MVDRYVEEQVLNALQDESGLLAEAVASSDKVEAAARAITEAEHELDLFVTNPKLLSLLGEQRFVEAVEARQLALDEARRTSSEARSQAALTTEIGDGDLLGAWPSLSLQEKRRLMHGLLDRVVVQRADRRGRHARPVAERAQIILRGNMLLTEPAAPAAAGLSVRGYLPERSISSTRYESGSCTKQIREPPSRTR